MKEIRFLGSVEASEEVKEGSEVEIEETALSAGSEYAVSAMS